MSYGTHAKALWFDSISPDVEDMFGTLVNELMAAKPDNHRQFLAKRMMMLSASEASSRMPAAPSNESGWTLAGWLRSRHGIAAALAHSLEAGSNQAIDISYLKFLGSSTPSEGKKKLLELLIDGRVLDDLATELWLGIEELTAAPAASGAELQAKFVATGAGTLSYSSIDTFYRGLEGIVGVPQPNVEDAMATEHTAEGGDRHDLFETGNYGIITTSAIEWRFVYEPDSPPTSGWPVETKIPAAPSAPGVGQHAAAWTASGAQRRTPMLLADLDHQVALRSRQLEVIGEPHLVRAEALGARLYTGPCYVKYNAVLRGFGSKVPVLIRSMVDLCCAKAMAAEHTNGSLTYAQTLHAINSSIVKLGKLTVATKVYRGVSGRVLPPEFWEANQWDVKGGIEGAFLSTTTNRDVAMAYAAGTAGGVGMVFEIQQGMLNRGADISFLSQYPHEKEILFGPLTGLELQYTRVQGSILAVIVNLSVNLVSLPLEQVIGKRKKMLDDMVPGLEAELRAKTVREGRATSEGVEYLVGRLAAQRTEGSLKEAKEWYNDDEHLEKALKELLSAARGLEPGGALREDELAKLDSDTLTRLGLQGAYGDEFFLPANMHEMTERLQWNRDAAHRGMVAPPRPNDDEREQKMTPLGPLVEHAGLVLQLGPYRHLFIRAGCVRRYPWARMWQALQKVVRFYIDSEWAAIEKASCVMSERYLPRAIYVAVSVPVMQAIDLTFLANQGFKFHSYRAPGHGMTPTGQEVHDQGTAELVYYCWPGPPETDIVPTGGGTCIEGATALCLSPDGTKVALVWERGAWSTPGGASNAGESKLEGLVREVGQELGLRIDKDRPIYYVGGWSQGRARDNLYNDSFSMFVVHLAPTLANDWHKPDETYVECEWGFFEWRPLLESWRASGSPVDAARVITTVDLGKGEYKKAISRNVLKGLDSYESGRGLEVQSQTIVQGDKSSIKMTWGSLMIPQPTQ